MVATNTVPTVKALQVTGDIIEVIDSDVEDTMTPITADQAEEVLGDPTLSLLVERECPRCAGHDIYQVITHLDTLKAVQAEFPGAKLYSHPAVELPTPVPAGGKIAGLLVLIKPGPVKDVVIGPITQEHLERLQAEVEALSNNPAYVAAVEASVSEMLPMMLMASMASGMSSGSPRRGSWSPLGDLDSLFGDLFNEPTRAPRRGGRGLFSL